MSGRVVRIDPATHKVVDTLLPWFVNGTLDADERALVERHIAECARCKQEVEWLRAFHGALIAGEKSSEDASAANAMRKLRRRWGAPRRRADSRGAEHTTRAPWTHWIIGAQLALIVGVGAILLQNMQPEPDRDARYRTLSAAGVPAYPNGTLVVVFDPSISEAELRRVLREAGARVVDGPTQSNAYVLDVPAARQAQALRALRAERAVTLAEELAPRSMR